MEETVMGEKGSLVVIKDTGKISMEIGPGFGLENDSSIFEVIRVVGLIPRLVFSNSVSGQKLIKNIIKGEKIVDTEINILENCGVMIEYFYNYTD